MTAFFEFVLLIFCLLVSVYCICEISVQVRWFVRLEKRLKRISAKPILIQTKPFIPLPDSKQNTTCHILKRDEIENHYRIPEQAHKQKQKNEIDEFTV